MSDTPRTDAIIAAADACPETRVVFLIKNLANLAKDLERELAERTEAADSAFDALTSYQRANPSTETATGDEAMLLEAKLYLSMLHDELAEESDPTMRDIGKLLKRLRKRFPSTSSATKERGE